MKYGVLCIDIRSMNVYRELGETLNVKLLSLQLSLPAFVYSRSLSTSKTCQITVLPNKKILGGRNILTFSTLYGNAYAAVIQISLRNIICSPVQHLFCIPRVGFHRKIKVYELRVIFEITHKIIPHFFCIPT